MKYLENFSKIYHASRSKTLQKVHYLSKFHPSNKSMHEILFTKTEKRQIYRQWALRIPLYMENMPDA